EVGDVEVSLQGKLLRAVEEGVVRRVGGLRDRKVNVHIIAATNRGLERDAQAAMLAYPWPGNVRELSHVIERAVLWSQGDTLEAKHLSLMSSVDASSPLPANGVELSQLERSLIEQALREAAGNQTKAAQRLGISRDTLRYRLKKFGL